jgi:hypothetical protein
MESKRAISSVDVRTLNVRKITVMANAFIVCCGGIENARILLNCSRDFANGLGNQRDLVGRFFMDHLFAVVGAILPQDAILNFGPLLLRHESALMNSAETVRQPGRRGCSLFMRSCYNCYDADTAVAKAMQSPSGKAFHQIMHYAVRGSCHRTLARRVVSRLASRWQSAAYFTIHCASDCVPSKQLSSA